ncbi:N-acetylmuramoyl-L-alanine amidase [Sinorhizobium saheli]|nr:N-acetylmuramoyl-L-alanine amidase [Sinorhizobium saheli]
MTSVSEARAAVNSSMIAIEDRLQQGIEADEQAQLKAAYARLWVILGQIDELMMEQAAASVATAVAKLERAIASAKTSEPAVYKAALHQALGGIGIGSAPSGKSDGTGGGIKQPTSGNGTPVPTVWADLITYYTSYKGVPDGLRVASLSQWILESGRGASKLAREHLNFGGLKYRERMVGYALPVDYTGTDGEATTYCRFSSIAEFVAGYWHFIRSGPYEGWDQLGGDGVAYIRHISASYAGDTQYVGKVLGLFQEARDLLGISGTSTNPGNGAVSTASDGTRVAVVVGHNRVSKGAASVTPINLMEFDFNQIVAQGMKSEAGHYNLDVEVFLREPSGSYTKEIKDAYEKVATWKPTCILELHFNSNSDPQANGLEMLCLPSANSRTLASKLVGSTNKLLNVKVRHTDGVLVLAPGDRGWQSVSALPNIPTVLCEPFFGSNPGDCVAAATVGREALGRAYLRGVRDWMEAKALNA